LSYQFFSEEVAVAMEHYQKKGVAGLQDCAPTVAFIRRINKLIDAMNASSSQLSLRSAPMQNKPAEEKNSEAEKDDPAEAAGPEICPECQCVHSEYGPKSKKTSREVSTLCPSFFFLLV